MIYFFCDCCGKKLGISENLVGRKGVCPDCGSMFVVPTESQSAPFEKPPPVSGDEELLDLNMADEPQEPAESSSSRMMRESPEWGGDEAPAPPPPPAAPMRRPATTIVPAAAPPRRPATAIVPAPPSAAPPRHRTSRVMSAPTPSSGDADTVAIGEPPPAAPAKRPPSIAAPAVPPPARPPGRPSSALRRAVQPAEGRSPAEAAVAARAGAREPVAARGSEPARRGGPGWGVVLVLAALQVASLGYIWKLGGFAPGKGAEPTQVNGPSKQGPKPTAQGAGAGEVEEPPSPPTPPPVEPPKEDPKPPTPPPVEPPKEDPKPPTPPPVEPPKEDPKPPPVEPPKEDPKPPPIQLTDPPKEDPKPPSPPPTEPPKEDPTPAPPTEPPPPAEDVSAALRQAMGRLAAARGKDDLSQQTHALDPLQEFLKAREVTQFLGKLLLASQEMPAVRQRAAEMLGDGGQSDAVAILERGIKAAHDLDSVARAAIAALGRIDDPASPRKLDALIRSRLVPAEDELDNAYALDAVFALGKVKRFRNIETLMALYLTLAQLYPGEVQGQTDEDRRKEDYRRMLEDATRSALSEITTKNLRSYQEWADWWQANRGNYK